MLIVQAFDKLEGSVDELIMFLNKHLKLITIFGRLHEGRFCSIGPLPRSETPRIMRQYLVKLEK